MLIDPKCKMQSKRLRHIEAAALLGAALVLDSRDAGSSFTPTICTRSAAHRGGIDERWFSSTTKASNGPYTLPRRGFELRQPGQGESSC